MATHEAKLREAEELKQLEEQFRQNAEKLKTGKPVDEPVKEAEPVDEPQPSLVELIDNPEVKPEKKEPVKETVDKTDPPKEQVNESESILNPDKKDDAEYLKQRVFTQHGMLKAKEKERKELKEKYERELADQNAKIAELQKRMEEREAIKEITNNSDNSPTQNKKELFQSLAEKYDVDSEFLEEFSETVKKMYSQNMSDKRIEELQSKLEEIQSKSQAEMFWNNVNSKVPEAKDIPNEVLEGWLDQPCYGNFSYRDMYQSALSSGDTETVAKILKDCARDVKSTKQQNIDPIPQNIRDQVSAQSLGSANYEMGTKPIFTSAQIKEFDLMVKQGKIPKDKARVINEEIDKAYMEGRIRG